MKIKVSKDTCIEELQSAFSHMFPLLKLEFLYNPYKSSADVRTQMVFNRKAHIDDVGHIDNDVIFDITPQMTVEKLLYVLETQFHAKAIVFRFCEGYWIDTTDTDWWTLEEQNNRACEAAKQEQTVEKHSEVY
jgi:hypothetical protein